MCTGHMLVNFYIYKYIYLYFCIKKGATATHISHPSLQEFKKRSGCLASSV